MKTPAILRSPRHRPDVRGFSLVEVVVAVGIASSVLVALIGLLSFGMESMRTSEETTVEAQLVEKIFSELQGQQDWDNIDGTTLYFDSQGEAVAGEELSDYAVKVIDDSARSVSLPGTVPNPYLRYVTIKIGHKPGIAVDFNAPVENGDYRQYSTILADFERDNS